MGLFSRWHGAEVRGRADTEVRCEGCGARYGFTIERVGTGREISVLGLEGDQARRLAREYAEANLATRLRDECDSVPCPACGRYQAAMLSRARDGYGWPALQLGVSLLTVGAILLALAWLGERWGRPSTSLPPLGGLALIVGGAVLYFRWERKVKYDPNSAPVAERLALGQERARLLESGDGPDAAARAESDATSAFSEHNR